MVTLDVRILSRSNKKGLFEHMVQKSTTPVVDHQISHENQKSWLFSEPPPFFASKRTTSAAIAVARVHREKTFAWRHGRGKSLIQDIQVSEI